jgi:hypothetical protein
LRETRATATIAAVTMERMIIFFILSLNFRL